MKKFLIIQTAFPGDVILATPLIEKIHHFYMDCKIDFLLRKGNEGILQNHPYIEELLIWDKKENKYAGLFKIWKKIRKKKYDMVINLQRFASTGLITWFSNAKIYVGFSKNPFAFAFTSSIPHEIGNGTHETERNLKLIEMVSDDSIYKPKLYPLDTDFYHVSKLKQKQYYCIAPASVWFTKQFPAERWAELIRATCDDSIVYLVGGKNDFQLCEKIKTLSGKSNIVNLCGELSFLQTAALMTDARMNFTNDSAPLHIASAMNAPVTAVFCSTVPAFGFGPLSDDRIIAEVNELACRPCGLHGKKSCPEKHFKCALSLDINKLISRL